MTEKAGAGIVQETGIVGIYCLTCYIVFEIISFSKICPSLHAV